MAKGWAGQEHVALLEAASCGTEADTGKVLAKHQLGFRASWSPSERRYMFWSMPALTYAVTEFWSTSLGSGVSA